MRCRDLEAKEMKGHDILAVERFRDDTRWMIEFVVRQTGEEKRLFLNEEDYRRVMESRESRAIAIQRRARIVEGHILDIKPAKRRRFPG